MRWREARYRAAGLKRTLLALGWSAALRRSELVGLDWHELGFRILADIEAAPATTGESTAVGTPQVIRTDAIASHGEYRAEERTGPTAPTRASMFPPPHFSGTFGWAHALSPARISGLAPIAPAFGPHYQIRGAGKL